MTVLNASTYLCPSCHSARFYQLSQEKMRRSHKGLGNIFNNIILSHEQHGWFSKYSSKHTAGSKSKLNKVVINHFSSSTFWHHWPPFFIFFLYRLCCLLFSDEKTHATNQQEKQFYKTFQIKAIVQSTYHHSPVISCLRLIYQNHLRLFLI